MATKLEMAREKRSKNPAKVAGNGGRWNESGKSCYLIGVAGFTGTVTLSFLDALFGKESDNLMEELARLYLYSESEKTAEMGAAGIRKAERIRKEEERQIEWCRKHGVKYPANVNGKPSDDEEEEEEEEEETLVEKARRKMAGVGKD